MKKAVLMIFVMLAAKAAICQQPAKTTGLVSPARPYVKMIPASKAVGIRKDVVTLKTQAIQLKENLAITQKQIDAMVDGMKNNLDSMSDMSETEMIALQEYMQKLERTMAMLSNIMKQMSDTQKEIAKNIK